ncbi:MAG: hypothetical protein IIB83_04655 [Bacteroidetes bacterium]|nr:hypothetical protein [Bacteroidota bacterium]
MKKIYIISAVTIIISVLFYLNADQFKFLWGAQILLLPIISGALMALVQSKNHSYEFLPGIIIGSVIVSFIFAGIIQVIECFNYHYGPHCPIPNVTSIAPFVLMLSGIFIFGGLVGIVIKGIFLLLKIKNKYGNVDIVSWSQNRIAIEVVITVTGNNEDAVEKKLKNI